MSDTMFEMLKGRASRYEELGRLVSEPEVYGNRVLLAQYQRERGAIREQAETYETLRGLKEQIDGTREIVDDAEADAEMKAIAREELDELQARFDGLLEEAQDMMLLDDEDDSRNCIVEIRGAEGGDEATLFARDLMEMYARFCADRRFKLEVIDEVESEVGGIRFLTCRVKGENVFKAFKYEGGGHRVQRVPATEAQGRVHTSLATVAILPEVEEVDIEIKESDLEIKAARSGGPGGQKVNKTSSRCQIRHLPSGIMVDCQSTPSFHKNRDEGMRILRAKLYEIEREKRDRERAESRGAMVGSGGRGDKIRTYNFPQDRCTDHRAKESFALSRVLEGRLDDVIAACRNWEKQQRLKELARSAS